MSEPYTVKFLNGEPVSTEYQAQVTAWIEEAIAAEAMCEERELEDAARRLQAAA